MITSKNLSKITAALICLCLIGCWLIVYLANIERPTKAIAYESKLFGDEIISLDIKVDTDEWQAMMDNAQAKEWICANVIINGEQFSNVGIRTKGNSSLSQARTDRYSLQIKFNKYVKGQTYYGLDAFCVNNMSGDSTYVKDYISYDIMKYIGVETPLTNYANVSVNGEHYMFGTALERYDKSYLGRAFNTSGGQLYSVKIGMGNRENFEDMRIASTNMPDMQQGLPEMIMNGGFSEGFPIMPMENGDEMRARGGGMGMFGGNGGGSLLYTDDDISSYSSIFDNAVFSGTSDKDKQRVITAIENLNAGTDLEKYFDVDQILRYFAAHTVVVNLDSYTSNMQQNYYIYERDGKLTILPWDYGLAFGGFQSGSASSVVNFPIDTPVSGVNVEDRPLLNKLLEVDEYREKYHAYLEEIVVGYFESGLFEDTITALDGKINGHVKSDTTALSTFEQYQASLPVLIELGNLRAASIRGQLNGTIPSTTESQRADNSSSIDASNINLSALGTMMGGGMRQGDEQGEQFGGRNGQGGNMAGMDNMQQAMQILMQSDGELTEAVKTELAELGVTEEQMEMFSNMQTGRFGGNIGQGQRSNRGGQVGFSEGQGNPTDENQNSPRGGNMPGMNNPNAAPPANSDNIANAIILAGLLLLLGASIFFVARPRKQ